MAVSEKSLSNLKPIPIQKGEVINPNGRPKGVKNRRTIAQEWLTMRSNGTNPDGETTLLSQADQIMISMIERAKKGDTNAAYFVFDSAYGKVANVTVTDKAPAKYDMSKLSTDELELMERAALVMQRALNDNNEHIEEAHVVE